MAPVQGEERFRPSRLNSVFDPIGGADDWPELRNFGGYASFAKCPQDVGVTEHGRNVRWRNFFRF